MNGRKVGRTALSAFCGALFSAHAWAAPAIADHTTIDPGDEVIPQQWLDRARTLDVYFGHQSVGANMLEGLKLLARQKPQRYRLVVRPEPSRFSLSALYRRFSGDPHKQSGIEQFFVGRNGEPEGKIADFSRRMAGEGRTADVAMMKLCFVDFQDPKTDPARLFADYRTGMERLEKSHPKVRFVWWTVPLMSGGNHLRNAYNRLIRTYAATHDKPLYDIADIESHDLQGRQVMHDGEPVMYAGYTQDGGHLTTEGKLRAARAWWWLAARLAGWPGPETVGSARQGSQ